MTNEKKRNCKDALSTCADLYKCRAETGVNRFFFEQVQKMSLPEMFVSWHGSQMGDDQRTEEGPVPTLLQEEGGKREEKKQEGKDDKSESLLKKL